jgi:hypothetical protein
MHNLSLAVSMRCCPPIFFFGTASSAVVCVYVCVLDQVVCVAVAALVLCLFPMPAIVCCVTKHRCLDDVQLRQPIVAWSGRVSAAAFLIGLPARVAAATLYATALFGVFVANTGVVAWSVALPPVSLSSLPCAGGHATVQATACHLSPHRSWCARALLFGSIASGCSGRHGAMLAVELQVLQMASRQACVAVARRRTQPMLCAVCARMDQIGMLDSHAHRG